MRWWLLFVLLAGCGDDLGRAPATLVRATTSACESCYPASELYGLCGNNMPRLDMANEPVYASTSYASTEIKGLIQVQYVTMVENGAVPYLDFILIDGGTADVPAIFGALDDPPLYRMKPTGEVIDVDSTRLSTAEDNALHFTYAVEGGMVSEDHVFDAPREVEVDAHADLCCSAGRPSELGLILVALLIRPRRRRKLRA